MHFAYAPSGWPALVLLVLLASASAALAFLAYRRPPSPLTRGRHASLITLRTLTLTALGTFLLRPVVVSPAAGGRHAVVPIVVDSSRSMRLPGTSGQSRIAEAASLLKTRIVPALSSRFTVELYSAGEGLKPAKVDVLSADAPRSDLTGALQAIRDRYRDQRIAGIVVLSDGGATDTGSTSADTVSSGPPIFAVGIGSVEGLRDREVAGLTAGEQRLDQASVDLHVTAISGGFGTAPFELRVLANGRVVDTRRVVPIGDGLPIDETFTVAPDPGAATAYRVEIPADGGDVAPENNARTVLVSPIGRKHRLLVVEGAPGFEHGFMTRAWSRDPGLDVDSIIRKGNNADGQNTFLIQAGPGRSAALSRGFPASREQLFSYDALVVANVEAEFFTRAQLAMVADFVSARGGGLLVLGGRSFAGRGFAGTPLEDALPVQLSDRGSLAGQASGDDRAPGRNRIRVTEAGERHPMMRIGQPGENVGQLWAGLPALAGSALLGAPRPGASVLAVTAASTGAVHPVIAVQTYGRGRSMVFGGEASWRWRMMLPSTDRTYEFFWRQAARWLTAAAPDRVEIRTTQGSDPGEGAQIVVDIRDGAFVPVSGAAVTMTVTSPDGKTQLFPVRADLRAPGRFTGTLRAEHEGVYHVHAEAASGTQRLGSADAWVNVGGADREFADPRLNEAWLRRVARSSGGRYTRANDVSHLDEWLQAALPTATAPEERDAWHQSWVFALVIGLLCAEWTLRRVWGLR